MNEILVGIDTLEVHPENELPLAAIDVPFFRYRAGTSLCKPLQKSVASKAIRRLPNSTQGKPTTHVRHGATRKG